MKETLAFLRAKRLFTKTEADFKGRRSLEAIVLGNLGKDYILLCRSIYFQRFSSEFSILRRIGGTHRKKGKQSLVL